MRKEIKQSRAVKEQLRGERKETNERVDVSFGERIDYCLSSTLDHGRYYTDITLLLEYLDIIWFTGTRRFTA